MVGKLQSKNKGNINNEKDIEKGVRFSYLF